MSDKLVHFPVPYVAGPLPVLVPFGKECDLLIAPVLRVALCQKVCAPAPAMNDDYLSALVLEQEVQLIT